MQYDTTGDVVLRSEQAQSVNMQCCCWAEDQIGIDIEPIEEQSVEEQPKSTMKLLREKLWCTLWCTNWFVNKDV